MSTLVVVLLVISKFMLESENPVKLSLQVMFLSVTLFLSCFLTTSKCWFPLIYFMLFLGGILIMFMILSSLLPNESMKKDQFYTGSLLATIAISLMIYYGIKEMTQVMFCEPEMSTKMAMSAHSMMIFLMALILLYFLVFINIMTSLKTPLRSQKCHKEKIL